VVAKRLRTTVLHSGSVLHCSQTFFKKLRNGPLKKLTQINTKQHVCFLLYQCDGCTCFSAISSAMFGSVLDNATLISWIASNRFRAVGLMETRAENADSQRGRLSDACLRRFHVVTAFASGMWYPR